MNRNLSRVRILQINQESRLTRRKRFLRLLIDPVVQRSLRQRRQRRYRHRRRRRRNLGLGLRPTRLHRLGPDVRDSSGRKFPADEMLDSKLARFLDQEFYHVGQW